MSTAVSAGASGVVFHREGNRYYALTARHVVAGIDGANQTRFIAMGYDDLDYTDTLGGREEYRGIAGYYQRFPEAAVEYSSDQYDLAVISFLYDKDLTALPVSDKMPARGDRVAAMGNPHGKRNMITAGKISSREAEPFGDEAGKMQYGVIRHTCVLSEGSSGSALLGENLEIVGINLGGGGNLFRRHLYGMAMPANRILDFLEEWSSAAPEGVLIPLPAGLR
ncbi:MAG: trypsin-like peptidase domain-containing protein [Firmicutes bacterium]|nr:trypsin-like peptidase domain-containing protein [Bacillota bacterium]